MIKLSKHRPNGPKDQSRGVEMFIDADTHVDECEDTWAHVPKGLEDMVPHSIEFPEDSTPSFLSGNRSSGSGYYRMWLIDGQLFPHRVRSDERTGTTLATRELYDVGARVKHMDELGVETQVIFPTVFLHEVTRRAELEVALYQSYNRWLAERCGDSGGRLRWVALIPYSSPADAVTELQWAKEHGAVGIFKRGIECGGRTAADHFFDRAYEVAADLDLPVCIHQAQQWTPNQAPYSQNPVDRGDSFPVVAAFSSLLDGKIWERFPGLRFGFIESSAAWLGYLLGRAGWPVKRGEARTRSLAELNFFVTVEVYEDIPYLIDIAGGEDNFVVGSDYCHGDRASVIDAHQVLIGRPDIDDKASLKITSENARSLYAL